MSWLLVITVFMGVQPAISAEAVPIRDYQFDGTISREVLENYLDRSVTMAFFLVPGVAERGRAEYLYREDDQTHMGRG